MDHGKALHKVLTDKGCSIWGRPFCIDQFEDREKCVTWILETLIEPFLYELQIQEENRYGINER